MPPFEWRRLRGMLAERRITYISLGTAAGLNPVFVSRVMRGVSVPGELARIRLARGLRALAVPEAVPAVGLPFPDEPLPVRASLKREVAHAGS
jgi:hypothetical protein